jgi:homoserine O-acetyltransferase/O-succinyltransferase
MSLANAVQYSGRTGRAHGRPLHSATIRLDTLALEHGGVLKDADVAFTLLGDAALPVVVVLGGISAGRDVSRPAGAAGRGWWQDFVGDGLAVDTRSCAVLGVDFLGGADGSTGPVARGFPAIGTADQAAAIAAVLDHLAVPRVHAIVGSSYGGMVALAFAARFGGRVGRLTVISAAHRSHPMATALRTLQRRVVQLGLDSGRASDGLALARGIAMTTYRTAAEFAARFGTEPEHTPAGFRFPVEAYLEHQGAAFARRFSPWSFLCLSESIDMHRVDPAHIATPVTLVAVDSDTLVPPWQVRALARSLAGPVTSVEIHSVYGHDAFLKEVAAVSNIIHDSLREGARS